MYQCIICDKDIKKSQSFIECWERIQCKYHKKCFKRRIAHINDDAISKGYNGLLKYKKVPCKCGGKIHVINKRWWY